MQCSVFKKAVERSEREENDIYRERVREKDEKG